MVTKNNVINVQLNNGTSDFASALATAGTTVETLAVNTTGAFDMSNAGLDWDNTLKVWKNSAGTIVNRLRIVSKKSDGTMYMSDEIEWNKVVKKDRKNYDAAIEQITFIGYNGTSGSVQAIDDNYYVVDVVFESNQSFFGCRAGSPEYKYGRYDSPASGTTQVMVIDGVATNLSDNLAREIKDNLSNTISIERITSSSTTATTTGDLTVVNGSNAVIAATDIDAGGVVVGDYFSIKSVAYKVIELDTTNQIAVLDQPYQGISETVADANVVAITAANAATGDWGIKLTGLPQPFAVQINPFEKVRFKVQLHDFGTTTQPNTTQVAYEGIGTIEQVSQVETELQTVNALGGNRLGTPPPNYPTYVNTTLTGYDVNYIQWYAQKGSGSNAIGVTDPSYKELVIYTNQAGTVTEWDKIFA